MTRKPRRYDWLLKAIQAERLRRCYLYDVPAEQRRAATEQAMARSARPLYTLDKEPRS